MRSAFGFVVFLTVLISVMTSFHLYIYANLTAAGLPEKATAAALLGLVSTLFLALPLSRLWAKWLPGVLVRACYWTGMIWMGTGFLLAFWFLVASLMRRAFALAGLSGTGWVEPRPWILATAALVALSAAYGMFKALGAPREARYRIDRRARYGAGKRARLVQISDVHLGLTLGTAWLSALVDRINALEPDLVLITGDLLDPEFPDDAGAARELSRLRSREGVFAVTGNHEFYAGIGRFLALMERSGIPVLANEARDLPSGLQVAGIHDQTAGRNPRTGVYCDLGRALSGIDPARPSLLMAHQPKELEPAAAKRVDLVLSGHTHAGQIFPFRALVRLVFRYVEGLHRLGPDTELIVCTGTGFWGPPLRVGTDSQLVVVELEW